MPIALVCFSVVAFQCRCASVRSSVRADECQRRSRRCLILFCVENVRLRRGKWQLGGGQTVGGEEVGGEDEGAQRSVVVQASEERLERD